MGSVSHGTSAPRPTPRTHRSRRSGSSRVPCAAVESESVTAGRDVRRNQRHRSPRTVRRITPRTETPRNPMIGLCPRRGSSATHPWTGRRLRCPRVRSTMGWAELDDALPASSSLALSPPRLSNVVHDLAALTQPREMSKAIERQELSGKICTLVFRF